MSAYKCGWCMDGLHDQCGRKVMMKNELGFDVPRSPGCDCEECT